jgi:hypothetical protein
MGLAATLGLTLLILPVPVAAADPTPTEAPSTPTLVADGPFGRVAGHPTGVAGPAPDPSELVVLDAWARGASVVIRATVGTLTPWRAVLVAEPSLDQTDALELGGDGDAAITFQDAGLFLLRVEGTIRPPGDAVEGTWWWRIAVPARDLPLDETGPPPPPIRLASGDDAVALEQGSGCWLGTCGDIGRVSPPDALPSVRTFVGAPLMLTLTDHSGISAWRISAVPTAASAGEGLLLGQAQDTSVDEVWIPAPAAGDWIVEVSVTFDRDRGHLDGYGRLRVAPTP